MKNVYIYIIIVKSTNLISKFIFFPFNRVKNDNMIIPFDTLNSNYNKILKVIFNQEIDIHTFNNLNKLKKQLLNIDTDNFEEKNKNMGIIN